MGHRWHIRITMRNGRGAVRTESFSCSGSIRDAWNEVKRWTDKQLKSDEIEFEVKVVKSR